MEIKGRHSTIRSWRTADVSALVKQANNANVARQLRDRFPHPYTAADARRFIEGVVPVRPVMTFAIFRAGEAVGGIGFSPLNDVERYSAEFGYWLGEPFWGRGIMTAAVQTTADYLLAHTDFVRLESPVFEWNPASMRVLEKCGFVREGVLRKSISKDGQLIDSVLYARVAERES